MFTAEKARTLTREANNIDIEPVFDAIEDAAKQGSSTIQFALEGRYACLANTITAKLKAKGFQVDRKTSSGQRDSFDYLEISW